MTTPPFRNLDDVVAGLAAWELRCRQQHDRRAIFLSLYGIVSAEMRVRVERRAFADNEWVHRYAVAFANLYREAFENYEAGRLAQVPKSWRLAFDAAKAGTGLVLQDMFLGVNAHVNNDLPFALTTISIEPDRQARYRDHTAVNGVLGSVTDRASERIAALYAPGLAALDDCAGQLDEMISMFSLDIARDSAWESALSLTNSRNEFEHGFASTLIGARAVGMARLLLAPSRNQQFVAACRRLESGTQWLGLIDTVLAHGIAR